jgi:ketosteroid isomerase-like protein
VSQADVDVVLESFEAFARRGLDAMVPYWDPDIDWRAIEGAPDDAGEIRGTAAMRRYYGEWVEMFDDITNVPAAVLDLGDGRVLSEHHVTGRAKRGGGAMELDYAVIQTVRDGKIVHGREYATPEEARAAAGIGHENLDVVRTLVATYGDVEAGLPHVAPDVEWIPRRAKTEGAYHGHEGVRRFMADTEESFETFEPRFELEELPDGRVLAWGSIHVRARGSGVDLDVPVGGLFEVRDGKVSRWEDFGSKEKALDAARSRG